MGEELPSQLHFRKSAVRPAASQGWTQERGAELPARAMVLLGSTADIFFT